MAGMEALLWQMAQKQAQQFNTSPASRFANDAGAEAGGKLNAAGQSFLKAIMAPGNALRGEYDEREISPNGSVSQFDPRMMDDATELAGTIGLSSMPMPRPVGSLGMGGRFSAAADIESFANTKGVSLSLSETPDGLRVSKIVVPKASRGQGLGTEIMQAVEEYSQQTGKPVVLTPSTDFGGSMSALNRFYRGLGYQPNSGKSKDFRFQDTMIRNPK